MLGLELGHWLGIALGAPLGDMLGCMVPLASVAAIPSARRLNSDTNGSEYHGCRMSLGFLCWASSEKTTTSASSSWSCLRLPIELRLVIVALNIVGEHSSKFSISEPAISITSVR